MTRSNGIVGFAALSLFLLAPAGPAAGQSTAYTTRPTTSGHFHEGELGELSLMIEQSLRCNCSCGLDTHSCQFQMQCGTSPGWSERIRRSLEAGETPEAIQASFVADFGTSVLMSPPAEGFNLVGYLLPAVAIVTAGMFIGLFLRTRAAGREGLAPVTELGEDDAERLRNALRQLDEAEGPDW
jgi:cytochrome c-type biogenesis protein CcmH/NrfF